MTDQQQAELAANRLCERIQTLVEEIADRHEVCAAGHEPGEVVRINFEAMGDPDTILTIECDACRSAERMALTVTARLKL